MVCVGPDVLLLTLSVPCVLAQLTRNKALTPSRQLKIQLVNLRDMFIFNNPSVFINNISLTHGYCGMAGG